MGLLSTLKSYITPAKQTADIITDGESRWWGNGSTWLASNTAAGEDVNQDSLMRSATCFACTKALAETIAGLPGCVYRDYVTKREEDTKTDAHELLALQPNPEMDAFTFWEMLVTRVINRGNFFAEIQRDHADRPVALWPIHNSRVEPMRDPADGSLYYRVAHDYQGNPHWDDPTWRDQHTFSLSPHNMLNVVGFNSTNGVMASGMLPGAEEIAMDFASRRYGGNFFSGGATPSGMVTHPSYIDNEAKRRQFREDLNRVHNNKTGGNGIGVLWQGATYQQISISPEQAQFLETRKFTADQICKFYGVPPAIIGDYEHSKFATADAMIRAFVMITLRNLAVRIEKAINRQVLSVKDERGKLAKAFTKPLIYEFALDGLLRGDPTTQAAVAKTLRDAGAISTNEMREQFDYNPMEGEEGDYHLVPGGFTRLDKIDNQGTRVQQAAGQPQEQEDKKASLPAFDRAAMAEMLEQVIAKNGGPTQVRGVTLAEDEPAVDTKAVLRSAIESVASDAVARIHKITLTQVDRWREQDPKEVATKLSAFWTKQRDRLSEALAPCDSLQNAHFGRDEHTPDVSYAISTAYYVQFARLDNYTVFDADNHTLNLNVAEEILRCCS